MWGLSRGKSRAFPRFNEQIFSRRQWELRHLRILSALAATWTVAVGTSVLWGAYSYTLTCGLLISAAIFGGLGWHYRERHPGIAQVVTTLGFLVCYLVFLYQFDSTSEVSMLIFAMVGITALYAAPSVLVVTVVFFIAKDLLLDSWWGGMQLDTRAAAGSSDLWFAAIDTFYVLLVYLVCAFRAQTNVLTRDIERFSSAMEETTQVAARARERVGQIEEGQEFLFASLAHQLKSPLAVARGYTELLCDRLDTMDQEQVCARLHLIQQNVDHLTGMVDRGLNAMRLDAGSWIEDPGVITNFNLAITDICTNLQPEYPRMQMRLCPDIILGVDGDEKALATIIQHLVDNATKYGLPNAPVFVETSTDQLEVVSVIVKNYSASDTAIDRKGLFIPFQPRAPEIGGAGIGLYTVSMLARAMLGSIDVEESTQGVLQTTSFRLQLPISKSTQIISRRDEDPNATTNYSDR